MSGPDTVTLALLERWLTGWSRSRGLPLPRHAGGGLTVEVGWPDQLRRYLFVDAGSALQECAARIDEPCVFIKATVDAATLRQALPQRWKIEVPRYMMIRAKPMQAVGAVPPSYRNTLMVEHGAYVVNIVDERGALSATGRITLNDRTAVFDRIETSEDHRRKGLASAVMVALDNLAIQAGVAERLLVATAAGAALYTSLGWRHLAPFSTAVLAA